MPRQDGPRKPKLERLAVPTKLEHLPRAIQSVGVDSTQLRLALSSVIQPILPLLSLWIGEMFAFSGRALLTTSQSQCSGATRAFESHGKEADEGVYDRECSAYASNSTRFRFVFLAV
jgi:hypothetical protein